MICFTCESLVLISDLTVTCIKQSITYCWFDYFIRNLSERESLSDDSDHEEEFYYTEVEEPCDEDSNTMQSFTETVSSFSQTLVQSSSTFSEDMHQMLATNTALDHDYQRKVNKIVTVNDLFVFLCFNNILYNYALAEFVFLALLYISVLFSIMYQFL